MVPLVKADFLRDSVLEPDAREEAMQQVHSTVVREACSTELYAELRGPSATAPKATPGVGFGATTG